MAEPLRILILEDKPTDVELIQFELQEAGLAFISKVVMTEEDFARGIEEYCPDIILSDYDLPRYNGALALAETRRRYPDTPFILVSGVATEDRAIEILTQGAKDYVLKNRLQQRLVPAVRRALAEAEEHRARRQAEAELHEAHRTLEASVKIKTAELCAEIASRKKVEEALKQSEEMYRVLFEGSTQGILAADIETKRFVLANPSICQMLGYSEEELRQLRVVDIHPKDALDHVMTEFTHLVEGKKRISSAIPCLHKDGTILYADIACSNTIIQERKCGVGFFADVTARKRVAEELRKRKMKQDSRSRE